MTESPNPLSPSLGDAIRRQNPALVKDHPEIMLEVGKAERLTRDCRWMEAEEAWLMVASKLQPAGYHDLHLRALEFYEACMAIRKRDEVPPVKLGPGGDFTREKSLGKKAPGRKANP